MKNRTFFNIPLNILIIGITTMLVAISTGAMYSITPFYLRDVLKLQYTSIGLVEMIPEAFAQFLRLLSGVLGDYLQCHKPMFVLGTFFSALSRPLFIFASGVGLVFSSKFSDRIGNGLSATPRDAYVSQNSPAGKKGAYLGLTMTFKTVGCAVGSGIVSLIFFFWVDFNLKTLLIITSVPSFLAVFVCCLLKEEKNPGAKTLFMMLKNAWNFMTKRQEKKAPSPLRANSNAFKFRDIFSLPKTYWIFLGVMSFFMLARAPEGYMMLSLKDKGLPMWFCTGAIAFFNVISTLVSYPSGWLSDKIGRPFVLILSFLSLTFSLLCFSYHSYFLGIVGVLLWGIQRSTSQILSVACISDLVPKNILGTAIGFLNLCTGVAAVATPFINGYFIKHYNFIVSYLVSTIISIVALFVLLFFFKTHKSLNIRKKSEAPLSH